MVSKEDFWAEWSERFPLTVTHSTADYGMPEGVTFERAGQSIFISKEEFAALAVPAEEATIASLQEVDNGQSASHNPAERRNDEFTRLDPLTLDPYPYKNKYDGSRWIDSGVDRWGNTVEFKPRPEYSQNREDYA